MRVRLFQSILALATVSLAGSASAHFELESPTPANPNDDSGGKGGPPCGPDESTTANVTMVTGGTMLPITINETVYHPGHYRVALAMGSRDAIDQSNPDATLKEPVVRGANNMVLTPLVGPGDSESADIMDPPVFPVLADGLFPHTSDMGEFNGMIAIPNVNCDSCTLQVIQFMADHAPDYFYRHCANLKITADPNKPIFNPNGMGGMGGMGGGGGGGGMAGGSGGAAGGGGGASGSSMGGMPVMMAGMPGVGGTPGGGMTAGGTGTVAPPNTSDESSCTVASLAGTHRSSLAASGAGLLLGLGWLARRRKRSG